MYIVASKLTTLQTSSTAETSFQISFRANHWKLYYKYNLRWYSLEIESKIVNNKAKIPTYKQAHKKQNTNK